jgi:aminomethyltransferase
MPEGTVFRFSENGYQVNAAEPLMRWLQLNGAGLDVEISDCSAEVAALALQGPLSRAVLQACFEGEVAELPFFRITEGAIAGVEVAVSRTGYTGDLGYEIWLPAQHAVTVWDALMQHGAPWGITPCGILAMDIARVEAGFVLLAVDYIGAEHALIPEHPVSPYELAMGWAVKLDKGPFVGRAALAAERAAGSPRRVVGIEIDWEPLEQVYADADLMPDLPQTACREPVPVYGDGHHVGRVTTRCWSTLLKKYIGIATVDARYADSGSKVEMEVTVNFRRKRVAARVTDLAHFRPERLRA